MPIGPALKRLLELLGARRRIVEFNAADVTRGIDIGVTRAQGRFSPLAAPASTTALRNQIQRALQGWPEDLSPSFVELIAELTTLAAVARAWNHEPVLRDDEVLAFLGHAAAFLNSFKHK